MSRRETFWTFICQYAPYLYLLLMIITVLFLLNVLSLVLAAQETGAYVVTVVNFFLLGGTGIGVALVLWNCKQM